MPKTVVDFQPMPGKILVEVDRSGWQQRSRLILLSNPAANKIGQVTHIYEPFNLHLESEDRLTEAYVQVGDWVIFGKHSGTEITVEGVVRVVLKESEILTKVLFTEEEDATIDS